MTAPKASAPAVGSLDAAGWLARMRARLDPPGAEPDAGAQPRGDHDLDGRAPAAPHAGEAAVLAPLTPVDGELHVILTVRPKSLSRHGGQICFPGGRLNAADAGHAEAALRETHEEIGLEPGRIELIGGWEPYLTGTGFRVTPFAGLAAEGAPLRACPREVDEIFTAPLAFLMDPGNHREETMRSSAGARRFTVIRYGDYTIWGATAGMLRALSERLRR